MKRRITSLILALALIVTSMFCFGTSVFAAADDCGATGSSVKWKYDSGTKTLTLTGSGATKDYGDTKLFWAPWHNYIGEIVTVNIGEGITTIGRLNFMSCTALKTVNFPSTLTTIRGENTLFPTEEYGAFRGCTALEEITLPNSIQSIEKSAFFGCSSLKKINFPESLTTIGDEAFEGCSALESVTLPDSLTSLGRKAFKDCTNLLTVKFGAGLTEIPTEAFFNTRIGVVEIPECITTIGRLAFANCAFMREVTVYNPNCNFNDVIEVDPFYNSSQTITFYGHSNSTTTAFVTNHPNRAYQFRSIDPCEHETTHEVITVAPTCTEGGTTTQVCDNCGFTISESPLPATGHTWELSEDVDKTAEDGHIYHYYVCSACGETKTELEHIEYVEGFYNYRNTATCTRAGVETFTCTVEGCTALPKVNTVPKGNHQIEDPTSIVEPTCTQAGKKVGYCTVCKDENAEESIPALGHQNVLTETLDNTLTDGHTYEFYTCSVCNEETIVSEHVEWLDDCYESTVITNPSCRIPGLRRDTCIVCQKTRNVEIPANGDHDWQEVSRTEPTCTATGEIKYQCTVCEITKTEYIPELGHDYQLMEEGTVAPTCTETGINKYKCSVCNLTKTDKVPALGHTQDEATYRVTKEPNCTDKGKATAHCTVCDTDFEMEEDALGHDFQDSLEEIPDQPGHSLNTPVCSRCPAKGEVAKVHTEWIEGYYKTTVVTKGSCTVAEITSDKCDLCGTTRTNTIPAPGHKYVFTGLNSNNRLTYQCTTCKENAVPVNPTVAKNTTWNVRYVNTKPDDTTLGYVFELVPDGVINAKDYAQLTKYAANTN